MHNIIRTHAQRCKDTLTTIVRTHAHLRQDTCTNLPSSSSSEDEELSEQSLTRTRSGGPTLPSSSSLSLGTRSGYAIVKWFSKPRYPYGTWLIPVVTLDGGDIEDQYGCVVRITDIEPCQISVDTNSTNDTFHMMRESGYDRYNFD